MSTYTSSARRWRDSIPVRQHTAFAEVLSSTHGRWQEIQCIWPLRAHIHIPTYRHTPIHRNRKSPKGKKQTPSSHNRVVLSIFFSSPPGAGQLSLALYYNYPLQAHTLYLYSMNINKSQSWYLFWAPITDAHYTKLHCSLCGGQHRRYEVMRKHLVHFPPTIVQHLIHFSPALNNIVVAPYVLFYISFFCFLKCA